MKNVSCLGLLIVVISNYCPAQNSVKIWRMYNNLNLSFDSAPPTVSSVANPLSHTCNTTIGDSIGNLLFYTDGYNIYNAVNDTMSYGAQLNLNACNPGWKLTYRSAIIIPRGSNPDVYYMFYQLGMCYKKANLNYLLVNMNLDNGLGDVVENSYQIAIDDTIFSGALAATRHANGKDWWLLSHEYGHNRFYRLLVTEDGVSGPFEQIVPNQHSLLHDASGQAVFSIDGSKYAYAAQQSLPYATPKIYVYDFDRCTGLLNNELVLGINPKLKSGCIEFSPNERFIYFSTYIGSQNNAALFQYDLLDSMPDQTRILIDSSHSGESFTNLQLGPDGKIYIGNNQTPYLRVIHNPDEEGLACNFERNAIATGNDIYYDAPRSLPNYPNYLLGPLPAYQATAGSDKFIMQGDTTLVGAPAVENLIYNWQPATGLNNVQAAAPMAFPDATTTYILTVTDTAAAYSCNVRQDSVNVFVTPKEEQPNPDVIIPTLLHTSQSAYLEILHLPEGDHHFEVHNALGQLVYRSERYQNQWNVKAEAAGVYLYSLMLATGERISGKIVLVR